jgi:hypothetical protein
MCCACCAVVRCKPCSVYMLRAVDARMLHLGRNQLSGAIPTDLGTLSELRCVVRASAAWLPCLFYAAPECAFMVGI